MKYWTKKAIEHVDSTLVSIYELVSTVSIYIHHEGW